MLQVITWGHCHGGAAVCDLCGATFEEHQAAASLVEGEPRFDGGNAPNNALALDICPACLEAGTMGAAQRIERAAWELRAHADELETLAVRVRAMPRENWLTVRELERAGEP